MAAIVTTGSAVPFDSVEAGVAWVLREARAKSDFWDRQSYPMFPIDQIDTDRDWPPGIQSLWRASRLL